MTDEVLVAALRELTAEMRALRAQLAERGRPRCGTTISRFDRERCAIVLPGISAAIGDETFTVRALLARAFGDDLMLLASIAQAVGDDDAAGRRLGKLLAKVEGLEVDGYRVERVDDNNGEGCYWKVVRL
jgi:hypothetical protein